MAKGISNTVRALRPDEFNCLLAIIPEREMGRPIRKALTLRFEGGFSISMAARVSGVTRQMVSRAEKTLLDKHEKIMQVYR